MTFRGWRFRTKIVHNLAKGRNDYRNVSRGNRQSTLTIAKKTANLKLHAGT
jgi:hypothetical protein